MKKDSLPRGPFDQWPEGKKKEFIADHTKQRDYHQQVIDAALGRQPKREAQPLSVLDGAQLEAYDIAPDVVIEGLLEAGDYTILHGPEKIGKSAAMLHLAISSATGRAWWDPFERTAPLRVVYVQAEVSEARMADRFRKMVSALTLAEDERELLATNFHLINTKRQPRSITDPAFHEEILMGAWSSDLLMVDPLSFFHFADENDAGETKHLCFSLWELMRTAQTRHLIIGHHSNKASRSKDGPRGAAGARGSSILTDYAGGILSFEEAIYGHKSGVKVSFALRSFPRLEPRLMLMEEDSLILQPWDPAGEANARDEERTNGIREAMAEGATTQREIARILAHREVFPSAEAARKWMRRRIKSGDLEADKEGRINLP